MLNEKQIATEKLFSLALETVPLEDVKTLINQGADFHAKDKNGNTIFILAARAGRMDIVQSIAHKRFLLRQAKMKEEYEAMLKKSYLASLNKRKKLGSSSLMRQIFGNEIKHILNQSTNKINMFLKETQNSL